MDQNQQEQKNILEQQLQWTKERIRILDLMDVKLYEMKRIAEYVLVHNLSEIERERLNKELNGLKKEFSYLEKQLNPILH